MKKKRGFTFVETLIVIGVITLLASTAVITINPAQRFEEARNRQREIHLHSILSAVEQKRTIERGWADCPEIPNQIDENNNPIFKTIGEDPANFDLFRCIVPSYLSRTLYDPLEGDRNNTKYEIWQNPFSKRVTLRFVRGDLKIVAGPAEYWILGIPTVITADPFNVRSNSAEGGGDVTKDGDSLVFERGVVWDISPQPTINHNRTVDGSGLGSFTSSITGLQPGVLYYLRAYARNDVGVSYGKEKTFSTCFNEGAVETLIATNILNDSATVRGSITCLGAQNPDRRIEWGKTESLGNVTSAGIGGFGDFSVNLTALEIGQIYYFRACIVSISGTNCGAIMNFTTQISPPRVTTSETTNITGRSVISGGLVTNSGGVSVTARGVCINTFGNPGTTDTCTTAGSGIGPFTSNISGLNPGTTYYVRAFATNSVGTGYGIQRSFTTSVILATVSTTEPSNVTGDSATTGGSVTDEGGGTVTVRGVCFNTTGNPTTSHFCTTDGSGLGIFTSSLSGLAGATTYFVRAYATNSAGTAYGEERSFRTVASPPQVTTRTAFNIGVASADSGGEVLSTGGEPVTARGICFNTFGNPTLSDNCTNDGSGLGLFTSFLSGLQPGTKYFVRAYATNTIGTTFGNQIEFTTRTTLATLTTAGVINIDYDSATSGGNITSDGGGDVTARGVCWSTSPGPHIGLGTCTNDGSGVGLFNSNITGLIGGTLYHIRAYATNSAGTAYGNALTFTTSAPQTPLLTTNEISNITRTTANSGGNITDQRGASVTARGVCWNTTGSPTRADNCTSDGSGLGLFNSNIVNLTPGTTYFVRAYATNSAGTGYGNQRSFTSNPLILPELTTSSITNLTSTSASSGGNIIDDGGTLITARGVCWNTTGSPTRADNCTSDGSGLGVFSSNMTGLLKRTTYFVRAYATNSTGTGYGNQRSFTTLVTLPVVETAASVTNITGFSATSGGIVTDHGGDPNTSRGVCWGTTTNPILGPNCTSDGTGTGNFVSNITGLSPGTAYFVRAYAANTEGVSYGVNRTFTTSVVIPTVMTTAISNIERFTATSGGNVTASGGASVTVRGVCWNTSGSPTRADTCTADGSGLGVFTSNITGLNPGTTYFVRAYATNSAGTGFGEQRTFTTIFPELATVTTTQPSNIRNDSATSGGNVTSDGGDPNTIRGVCFATVPDPRYGIHTCTTNGNGVGSFESQMTGLILGQTYFVRAYAHNARGTSYGEQFNFTTVIIPPTVSTNAVSLVTTTTATSGGNVTNAGGGTVTARGVCYSTSRNPEVGGLGVTCVTSGSGTGTFTSNMANLNPGTIYFVRAYATNSAGHGYGEERSFTTRAILTVTKTGTGTGVITSNPTGINCGTTCAFEYAGGTNVEIIATPDISSDFAGWDTCPGTINGNRCTFVMNQNRIATARFNIKTFTLTVNKHANSTGTGTVNGGGIDCGPACTTQSLVYNFGTNVTLSAVPSAGSILIGWSGGCTGTAGCSVNMTANRTVTAEFEKTNIVFVTSTAHTGNLGGITGANQICQTRATGAGLPGTYRAWLSSSTQHGQTILPTTGSFRLPTGELIATSKSDMLDGTLLHKINRTEGGHSVEQEVWTSTNAQGNAFIDTCANWTSNTSTTWCCNQGSAGCKGWCTTHDHAGVTGTGTAINLTWTELIHRPCPNSYRLICIRQ